MIKTREEWLHEAVNALRPAFFELNMEDIPARLHLSVGFGRRQSKTMGQCWTRGSSADSVNHIFIAPHQDPVQMLATLVHELIHAADNNRDGHGKQFRRYATGLGLAGKMTATHAGPELHARLTELAKVLGPFPHGKLTLDEPKPRAPRRAPAESVPDDDGFGDYRPHSGPPKQGTRMLKLECECGYTVRTTQKWIDVGSPTCPDGHTLEVVKCS